MTTTGRFVTARHVVQPWRFPDNGIFDAISALESRGAMVNVVFEALSQSGDKFNFSSNNIKFDDSKDKFVELQIDNGNGEKVSITKKERSEIASDWAYVDFGNRKGTIKLNNGLSKSLKSGSKLYPVGFSYTEMLQPSSDELKPLLSECMVAQNGLTDGLINATARGFGQGNSGGPVFAFVNGEFQAVGIVSHGLGAEIGIIVPVVNIW